MTDRKGNHLDFHYNTNGTLNYVEDNVGSTLTFAYSTQTGQNGLISTVSSCIDTAETDKVSKTYHYAYDANRRLTNAYIAFNGQYGEEYTYTEGYLTKVKNPGGYDYTIGYNTDALKKITGVTNPLNQVFSVGYSTDNGDILVTTEFKPCDQQILLRQHHVCIEENAI